MRSSPVHPYKHGVTCPALRPGLSAPGTGWPPLSWPYHLSCAAPTQVHGPSRSSKVSLTGPPTGTHTLWRTRPSGPRPLTPLSLAPPAPTSRSGTEAVRRGGAGVPNAGRGHQPGRPPRGSPSCPGCRPDNSRAQPEDAREHRRKSRPRTPARAVATPASTPPPSRTARRGGAGPGGRSLRGAEPCGAGPGQGAGRGRSRGRGEGGAAEDEGAGPGRGWDSATGRLRSWGAL